MTETGENWKIALDFKKPNSYHLISSHLLIKAAASNWIHFLARKVILE